MNFAIVTKSALVFTNSKHNSNKGKTRNPKADPFSIKAKHRYCTTHSSDAIYERYIKCCCVKSCMKAHPTQADNEIDNSPTFCCLKALKNIWLNIIDQ